VRSKRVCVPVKIDKMLLKYMDILIEKGLFESRSDIVREGIRRIILEYLPLLDKHIACPICGARYKTFGALLLHAKSHVAGLTCPICKKSFRNEATLRQHFKKLGYRDPAHALLYVAVTNRNSRDSLLVKRLHEYLLNSVEE